MDKETRIPKGFGKASLISDSDGLAISVLFTEITGIKSNTGKPRGIIQIVHGMCEHKERYIPFMEYLSGNGYICVIHDHRGHGESVKSDKDLGYFYEGGYLAMINDIKMVGDWIKSRFPNLPHILFGHSMGSMAVRSFTKRYDFTIDGLIVCGSPSENPAAGAGKLLASVYSAVCGKKARPKLIQSIAFGTFNKPFSHEKSANAWICSDPEIVAKYDRDPYCNFQFTANGFHNLFSLMQDAYSKKEWKVGNPALPVMFTSGEDDPCLVNKHKFGEAVSRMKEVGYTNVSSILYPGMRHEILNEKGKERVWNDVLLACDRITAE